MPIHLSPRPIRAALRKLAGSQLLHRCAVIASVAVVVLAATRGLVALHDLAPIGSAAVAR
jgi:predicted DNA repair protein MutK